jgi:hypothetical protein
MEQMTNIVFPGCWVPKDGENISEADKASSHEFNKFSEPELRKVKVRLLSA